MVVYLFFYNCKVRKTSQPFKNPVRIFLKSPSSSGNTVSMLLDKVDVDFIPVYHRCVSLYMLITRIDLQ